MEKGKMNDQEEKRYDNAQINNGKKRESCPRIRVITLFYSGWKGEKKVQKSNWAWMIIQEMRNDWHYSLSLVPVKMLLTYICTCTTGINYISETVMKM